MSVPRTRWSAASAGAQAPLRGLRVVVLVVVAGFFEEAVDQGADLYLSGEISEPTVHIAEETGVPYLSCGHHATERFGIQALGAWVEENCGLQVTHIDIDNPV